jgi:hypothetical protein
VARPVPGKPSCEYNLDAPFFALVCKERGENGVKGFLGMGVENKRKVQDDWGTKSLLNFPIDKRRQSNRTNSFSNYFVF